MGYNRVFNVRYYNGVTAVIENPDHGIMYVSNVELDRFFYVTKSPIITNDMTLEELNDCFAKAEELGYLFVGISIDMGMEKDEIIINPASNFKDKLDYINSTYDRYLEHKHADNVRITGFAYADSHDDIGYILNENKKQSKSITIGDEMPLKHTRLTLRRPFNEEEIELLNATVIEEEK